MVVIQHCTWLIAFSPGHRKFLESACPHVHCMTGPAEGGHPSHLTLGVYEVEAGISAKISDFVYSLDRMKHS